MRNIAFRTIHNGNWCIHTLHFFFFFSYLLLFYLYLFFFFFFIVFVFVLDDIEVVIVILLLDFFVPSSRFNLFFSVHLFIVLRRICLANAKRLQLPFPFVCVFIFVFFFHWKMCVYTLLLPIPSLAFDVRWVAKFKIKKTHKPNKTK